MYNLRLETALNGSWLGSRRGYHYLGQLRNVNFPAVLTYLEFLCVITRVYRSNGQEAVDRLNLPCTSQNIPAGPSAFSSHGWLPTILVYVIPRGSSGAYSARIGPNPDWYYVPTNAEVSNVIVENSGGSAYTSSGVRLDNILMHKFTLPQRARLTLNPDRMYLLALTFTPRNPIFPVRADEWNPTVVRSLRHPYNCANQNEILDLPYEYYTMNSNTGSLTCRFNLLTDNVPYYITYGRHACNCGNRNERGEWIAAWGEGRVIGFRAEVMRDCGADVDCSGCVDDSDLLRVLFSFGSNDPNNDPNRDGVVDDGDLLLVLFSFGQGC
ncbi:MAG: hypothetical protein NZT61_02965 [Deltaproteobacteria bacterium]|nr:hypothetical protein [Deltaproteobacteria bacterium]